MLRTPPPTPIKTSSLDVLPCLGKGLACNLAKHVADNHATHDEDSLMNVHPVSTCALLISMAAASVVACGTSEGSDDGAETTPVAPSGTGAGMLEPTASMLSPNATGPENSPAPPSSSPAVQPMSTTPVAGPSDPQSVSPEPDISPQLQPVDPVAPVNPVAPVEPPSTTEPTPPSEDCVITVTSAEVSERIGTVGLVEWSTDLSAMTDAWIEFGKDTTYGLTAPVDLEAPNLRTVLLGMEGSSTYNFRIVVKAGEQTCTGENQTLETGPVPNVLRNLDVETSGEVAKGFIITSNYAANGHAYILNEQGSPVWFSSGVAEPTRARMSYDGKYMWIGRANVPKGNNGAQMMRVAMDGSEQEDLSSQFMDMNHDFAITPDESVVFIAYGAGGSQCDDVRERTADGQVRTIVNAGDAHGEAGRCHLNAIHYLAEDDTVVFSDLEHDSYTKVKRDTGETVWVLGGQNSSFTGEGASWDNQHGFHLIGLDRILIFNNGPRSEQSLAIEIALDLDTGVATREWEYGSGLSNNIMGDAQRLNNGHTLVTYSVLGIIQEVDAEKNIVQTITSGGAGDAFGYAEKRESLYGPPAR